MKFLKKLILSEKLEYIPKDIEIEILDYSKVSVISKGIEDFIISNANVNNPKAMDLLLKYTKNKIFTLIQKDPNWKDPKKRIWAEAEKKIVLDPRVAFNYAKDVIYDQIQEDPTRWAEGEKIITTNAEYSHKYAAEIIKEQILNDPNWKDPKKRRWAKGEKTIALIPSLTFYYAKNVIYNQIQEDPTRWSEGEKTIATHEEYSYKYATEIIKQQILNDPNWRDPEKRRWAEGEKIIAKSKEHAYSYGFYVIKDQIKQDPDRWREGEQTIATYLFVEPSKILAYATMIKDQLIADPNRWTEGVKTLARDPNYIPKYAEMTNRPFPEGEEYLMKFGGYRADYKDFIRKNWDSFTDDQKKRVNPKFLTN